MNACLSDFRVVNPTLRTFSAAEARIAQSSIRFNNLSAAELGYPENVRLLISSALLWLFRRVIKTIHAPFPLCLEEPQRI